MTDHDHSLCVLSEGVEAFCLATGKHGPCVGQKRVIAAPVVATPKLRAVPDAPVRDQAGEARRAAVVAQNQATAQRVQMIQQTGHLAGKQAAPSATAQRDLKRVTTATQGVQRAYEGKIKSDQAKHDAATRANDRATKGADATNARRQAGYRARVAKAAAAKAAAPKKPKGGKSSGPVSVAQWLKYGIDGADTVDFWLGEFASRPGKCMYCDSPATHGVRWAEGMARIPVDKKHLAKARATVHREEGPGGIVGVDEVKAGKWVNHIGNYASVQVDESYVPVLDLDGATFALYGMDLESPYAGDPYGWADPLHLECGIGTFCRNPLHPGPCKGWKHMLHSVSPATYHAMEQQRVAKLNAARKAKIAALEAAGKKVPSYLKKPVTYKQIPDAPVGSPYKAPTPAEAAAALPPTKTQIEANLKGKHAAKSAAIAHNPTATNKQKVNQHLLLDEEAMAKLPPETQKKVLNQLKVGAALSHHPDDLKKAANDKHEQLAKVAHPSALPNVHAPAGAKDGDGDGKINDGTPHEAPVPAGHHEDLHDVLHDKTMTAHQKITALPIWSKESYDKLPDAQKKQITDLLTHVADSPAYNHDQKADAVLTHEKLTGKKLHAIGQTGDQHVAIAGLNSESWNESYYSADMKAKTLGKLDKKTYDALNHKQKARADEAIKQLEAANHPDIAGIKAKLGLDAPPAPTAPEPEHPHAGAHQAALDAISGPGTHLQKITKLKESGFKGAHYKSMAPEHKAKVDQFLNSVKGGNAPLKAKVTAVTMHDGWQGLLAHHDSMQKAAIVAANGNGTPQKRLTAYSKLNHEQFGELHPTFREAIEADLKKLSKNWPMAKGIADQLHGAKEPTLAEKLDAFHSPNTGKLTKVSTVLHMKPEEVAQLTGDQKKALADELTAIKAGTPVQIIHDKVDEALAKLVHSVGTSNAPAGGHAPAGDLHPLIKNALDYATGKAEASRWSRAKVYDKITPEQWDALAPEHKATIAADLHKIADGDNVAASTIADQVLTKLGLPDSEAKLNATLAPSAPAGPTGALTKVPGSIGSTHGAYKATDEAGKEWVVKPKESGKGMIPYAEAGVSQLANEVGLATPHVQIQPDGSTVQEWVPGSKPAFPGGFDPKSLSAADVLSIQKHHVLDWLTGQHDAHSGNWLKDANGKLVEIDKGQAFKFYNSDKLSTSYHPNHMEKPPIYNALVHAASVGEVKLHDPNSGELGAFIKHVQALSDDKLKEIFKPYAEATKAEGITPPGGSVNGFLSKLIERKNNLDKAFADLHKDAGVTHAAHALPDVPAQAAAHGHVEHGKGKFEILSDTGQSGDGHIALPGGGKGPWGHYGAAGVMIKAPGPDGKPRYLLVQRGPSTSTNKGKWQLPGGALDSKENAHQGAARETHEELGASPAYLAKLQSHDAHVYEGPAGWKYTSIAATHERTFDPQVDGTETGAAKWFTAEELAKLDTDGKLIPALSGGALQKNVMSLFPDAAPTAPTAPTVNAPAGGKTLEDKANVMLKLAKDVGLPEHSHGPVKSGFLAKGEGLDKPSSDGTIQATINLLVKQHGDAHTMGKGITVGDHEAIHNKLHAEVTQAIDTGHAPGPGSVWEKVKGADKATLKQLAGSEPAAPPMSPLAKAASDKLAATGAGSHLDNLNAVNTLSKPNFQAMPKEHQDKALASLHHIATKPGFTDYQKETAASAHHYLTGSGLNPVYDDTPGLTDHPDKHVKEALGVLAGTDGEHYSPQQKLFFIDSSITPSDYDDFTPEQQKLVTGALKEADRAGLSKAANTAHHLGINLDAGHGAPAGVHPSSMAALELIDGYPSLKGTILTHLDQVSKADFDKLGPADQDKIADYLYDIKTGSGTSEAKTWAKGLFDKFKPTDSGAMPAAPHVQAPVTHATSADLTAPHVKEAVAYAEGKGPKAQTSKNQMEAYGKLTAEELHALPQAHQDTIKTHMIEAKGKFLDPKKQAAAQAILDKLSGPVSHTAPAVHVTPSPALATSAEPWAAGLAAHEVAQVNTLAELAKGAPNLSSYADKQKVAGHVKDADPSMLHAFADVIATKQFQANVAAAGLNETDVPNYLDLIDQLKTQTQQAVVAGDASHGSAVTKLKGIALEVHQAGKESAEANGFDEDGDAIASYKGALFAARLQAELAKHTNAPHVTAPAGAGGHTTAPNIAPVPDSTPVHIPTVTPHTGSYTPEMTHAMTVFNSGAHEMPKLQALAGLDGAQFLGLKPDEQDQILALVEKIHDSSTKADKVDAAKALLGKFHPAKLGQLGHVSPEAYNAMSAAEQGKHVAALEKLGSSPHDPTAALAKDLVGKFQMAKLAQYDGMTTQQFLAKPATWQEQHLHEIEKLSQSHNPQAAQLASQLYGKFQDPNKVEYFGLKFNKGAAIAPQHGFWGKDNNGQWTVKAVVPTGHEADYQKYLEKLDNAVSGQAAHDVPTHHLAKMKQKSDGGTDKAFGSLSTKSVAAAIYQYSQSSTTMNRIMRALKGKLPDPKDYSSDDERKAAKAIVAIDAGMKEFRTTEDVVMMRGFDSQYSDYSAGSSGNVFQDSWSTSHSLVGAEWIDPAFGSTSTQHGTARNFSGGGDTSIVMRLFVPKGTPMVAMDTASHFSGESEILLGRNTKYRVVADHGYQNGKRMLDVEVVAG